MKVRVIRVFRVPDCDTRTTQNKFEFCKLLPEIPKQNLGFRYFGSGFGFFAHPTSLAVAPVFNPGPIPSSTSSPLDEFSEFHIVLLVIFILYYVCLVNLVSLITLICVFSEFILCVSILYNVMVDMDAD
jgi:hypothetical protein